MALLEWIIQAPWASLPELAAFEWGHRSTVSRQMATLLDSGLVAVRNDGRLLRPKNRVLATTAGLAEALTNREPHPMGAKLSDHHPFYPEWEGHSHPCK